MIDRLKALEAVKFFINFYPPRQEYIGQRDLEMSLWIRKNCRPSKPNCTRSFYNHLDFGSLVVSDLDFIFYDYSRKVIQLIECKTRNGQLGRAQKEIMELIDNLLEVGARELGITYLGYHVVTMDGTTPDNSLSIRWDNEIISRNELIYQLNMVKTITG